jgi:hypothetical protein
MKQDRLNQMNNDFHAFSTGDLSPELHVKHFTAKVVDTTITSRISVI